MGNISLSKFVKDDVKFIQQNLSGFFNNPSVEIIESCIEKWRNGLGFCINYDNHKVGMIVLSEKQNDNLSFGIMVIEKFRGHGIAEKAFVLAIEKAKQCGYSKVISSCAKENIASKKMHQKLGFNLVKEEVNLAGNKMYRWQKEI